jgi:hypothetical protein
MIRWTSSGSDSSSDFLMISCEPTEVAKFAGMKYFASSQMPSVMNGLTTFRPGRSARLVC